jgi:hypothetical protein
MAVPRINHDEIERLYKKAILSARIHGFHEEAYDFAGWIAIKWLEGKCKHQAIDFSLIDYLREQYGHDRRAPGRKKLSGALRASELAACADGQCSIEEAFDRVLADNGHIGRCNPESASIECDDHRAGAGRFNSPRKREVYELLRKGFNLVEIGKLSGGISESRVSQIVTQMRADCARQDFHRTGIPSVRYRRKAMEAK